ncbi:MAG: tyrosine-type recombinase/integrase [Bacteroidia bacterium]
MLEKFLGYLRSEKKFSPHTIVSYQNDMEQFLAYMEQVYEMDKPEDATAQMIRSWMAGLMQEKISARSVIRKASTLRTFYKFLLREGLIANSPMVKISAPKTPSRLPVFVNKKEMDSLFSDIEFPEGFTGKRDRLALELFYATGIRRAELITLKDSDVNLYNLTIKVLGKRNKERIIPITPFLKKQLEEYRNEKNKIASKSENFFVNENGTPLYDKEVYRIVKKYLGEVTTLKKKSPHVLRHTFATHILDNGADINAVKELLGHANLSATQVYTHNTLEKLKRVHKQAHPRG